MGVGCFRTLKQLESFTPQGTPTRGALESGIQGLKWHAIREIGTTFREPPRHIRQGA